MMFNQAKKSFLTGVSLAALSAGLAPGAVALTVRDDVTVEGSEQLADNPAFDGAVQIYMWNPDGGIFFNCSASLINHRTAISAAHCFNALPSQAYGVDRAGGDVTPIVAYGPDTFDALFGWLGSGGALEQFEIDDRNGLTFGSQVFLHPDGDAQNGGLPFPGADVALIALNDPLDQLPSYSMLFSPVEVGEHVVQVAYGGHGIGSTGDVGIDGKRQAGENLIGLIGSQNDFLRGAFRSPTAGVIDGADADQVLYHLDFDRPDRDVTECRRETLFIGPNDLICDPGPFSPAITADGTSATSVNDSIDWFPDDDNPDALENEAGTAGGDSGSAIFFDELVEDQLIIGGVLSGGWTFTAPFGSGYGDVSYYNPLFLFSDWIAETNPYKYVSAVEGDGNWSDAGHWVQDLDPGYLIIDESGNVVNGLPDSPELGVTGGQELKDGVIFDIDINDPEIQPPAPADTGVPAGANQAAGVSAQSGAVTYDNPSARTERGEVATLDESAETRRQIGQVTAGSAVAFEPVGQVSNDSETQGAFSEANIKSTLGTGLVTTTGPANTPRVATLTQGDVTPPSPAAGPGSTGFVPNNTDRDIAAGISASYFEVTLRNSGTTTADVDVVIDKLTLDNGGATLAIADGVFFESIIDTQIASGTLDVMGGFRSRDILNGGLVTGNGTIYTDTLFNAGAIQAGAGGLNVNGDVVFTSAGALIFNGYSLNVDGDVSLAGQAVLDSLAPGNSGTLLTFTGDRVGEFNPFDFEGVRQVNINYLTGEAGGQVDFAVTAEAFTEFLDVNTLAPNTGRMAAYLDTLRGEYFDELQDVYDSVDFLAGLPLVGQLDSLVPDTAFQAPGLGLIGAETVGRHVSGRIGAIGAGRADGVSFNSRAARMIGGLNNRDMAGLAGQAETMASAAETGQASGRKGYGLFGEVSFSNGDHEAGSQIGDSDIDSASITLGGDREFMPGVRAGVFVNYTEGDSTLNDGVGSTDTDGFAFGAYGVKSYALANLSAYFGYGQRDIETARNSTVGGILTGETEADEIFAGISASAMYPVDKSTGFSFAPEARLDYIDYDVDGYTEQGASAAMTIADRDFTSIQLKVGGDLHLYDVHNGEAGAFRPSVGARIVHDFEDDRDDITATFVGGPANAITLLGSSRDSTWGELRGALNFGSSEGPFQGAVFVEGTAGRDDLSYTTVGLNVRARF